MSIAVTGIHHVTAIGGEPATNLDFYTRVLGLRLVKRTVNYDDPGTWHLYFADRLGHPGTNMTFFPHPLARPGQPGSGEVARTAFAIPRNSLHEWHQRLETEKVAVQETASGNRPALELTDPHGTRLALVEADQSEGVEPWADGGVPAEMAIRGFESVCLSVRDVEATATFLRDLFDLRETDRSNGSRWFEAAGDGPARRIEIAASSDPAARMGAGSVHHVAFRVPDDGTHLALRQRLVEAGIGVTEVKDRQYFRSIYFREPGGVIFEIATDGPGFEIDETESELGQALRLPPWLEPHRDALAQSLPPLTKEASQ